MAKNIWETKRKLFYVKIGVFFLSGIILLSFAVVTIKDFTFFKPAYQIDVMFGFAEGLKRSSPVRFCGVDVGEVRSVRVINTPDGPRVKVTAGIGGEVGIPKGSHFFINSLSLFGEKYLEITSPVEFSGYIESGEVVEGVSPVPLFQLFSGFNKTMEEIKAFVEDGQIKAAVEDTIKNLQEITLKTRGLVSDISQEQGTVGRLLYDDSLYRKTEEFIMDIKENPWKLLHKPRGRK